METVIRQIEEPSEALAEAFARLLPQLSPRLGAIAPEAVEKIVRAPQTALFAACRGERIEGLLLLAWYDAPSGRKAWVEDVVVDAALRGCGAGEALVRAALEKACSVGADRVMLTSAPAREAARALYRKVGFEEAETSVFVRKLK